MNHRRGFSLAELLAVVAIILLLISFLLTGTQHVMSRSVMLKCQNRLEKIGNACQMFANENQRWPGVYDRETYLRWYEVLAPYTDGDRRIFNCPELAAPGSEEAEDGGVGPTESDLPMLLYNTEIGRSTSGWHQWDRYARFRNWYDENIEAGLFLVQGSETTLIPISDEHLSGASQVWFICTEKYTYHQGGQVFSDSELSAIRSFHQRGGGIHCLSESYQRDDYYRSTNEILEACGDVGLIAVPYAPGVMMKWQAAENSHPVMQDEEGYIRDMRSAGSVVEFEILDADPCARIIGRCTVTDNNGNVQEGSPADLIAAWDNGIGRVLLHGSYTSFTSSGYSIFPYGDTERYCQTSDAWLRKSGGMRAGGQCTYGYNSLVGLDAGRPGADTVVVMDYANWRIVRAQADPDKNDPDSYIATRHEGKANALLGDGSVRAFYLEDIRDGMWTPAPGD
ncbi:MAG: prepilin-type N-terminal cleavage/methylation domain-containing protein [Planctomycetota bacterium]